MKRTRPDLVPFLALIVALALLATACATLRDNIRKAAIISGEVALNIDTDEQALYASGAYSAGTHKQIGEAIVVMLTAVRAYERAARAWPENVAMPANVPAAMAEALQAVATVERIIADIPGNGKLMANLAHVRSAIGGQ
jgi:hypothetical protein